MSKNKINHVQTVSTATYENGRTSTVHYDRTHTHLDHKGFSGKSIISLCLMAFMLIVICRIYTGKATMEFSDILDFIDNWTFSSSTLADSIDSTRTYAWSSSGIFGILAVFFNNNSAISGLFDTVAFIIGVFKYLISFIFKFVKLIFGF